MTDYCPGPIQAELQEDGSWTIRFPAVLKMGRRIYPELNGFLDESLVQKLVLAYNAVHGN